MSVEIGTPVAWLRKVSGKRQRIRLVGRVTDYGRGSLVVVRINGSAYEVNAADLRPLKPCVVCGEPVDRKAAIYCSRYCFSADRMADTRQAIFDYLVRYKSEHDGLSPTIRQIEKGAGANVDSVIKHLTLMADDGLIWFVGHEPHRLIGVRGGRWTYEVGA